jgi:hypothetical protein
MTKAVKKTFYGKREDDTAPRFVSARVVSRNNLEIKFSDASRFDETTVLDVNNYTLTKSSEDIGVNDAEKVSYKNGIYTVLLTVDDLGVGSYTLKLVDIADEFGNAMSERKVTVNVKREDLAAATVAKYEVTDVDTIKVTFTKPLNEATAEDVSKYEFDNDIGAPIKVTYNNDDYSVKIETAEFKQGKTYKLTIDGVEDLAGNVLDLNFKFVAVKGDKDEDAPELVDVYAVNKYVVAVVFDEEVEYANNAKIVLQSGETTVTLKAKTTSEDDTVVEFSDYKNELNNGTGKTNVLNPNLEYTIESIEGISDTSGNAFEYESDAELIVYGTGEEPEAIEVLNIAQINAKEFEITMSDKATVESEVKNTDGTKVFYAKVDKDDNAIVYFERAGTTIKENDEYKVDLRNYIKDKHGIPTKNIDKEGYTVLYAEYEDDESPYIVNVVAKDRYTVEIEYSEELGKAGSYTIKNADENVSKSAVSAKKLYVKQSNKKIVVIELNNPLEGRYDYKLIIGSTAAEDLAKNKAEEEKDDEFFFNGTDLAPVATDNIAINAVTAAEEKVSVLDAVYGTSEQDDINEAQEAVDAARGKVEVLADGGTKDSLNGRLDVAQNTIGAAQASKDAKEAVEALFVDVEADELELAEDVDQEAIDAAQDLVDALPDGPFKEDLQELIETAKELLD